MPDIKEGGFPNDPVLAGIAPMDEDKGQGGFGSDAEIFTDQEDGDEE